MSDVSEVYTLLLVGSGKLKMRATARLAEGTADSVFEACVLLHEAARAERRAIAALASCPATTRLTAVVEECFCLVEGRDPVGAAGAWARVLRERREVDPGVASALLARLEPRYVKASREFQARLAGCTTLVKHLQADGGVASSARERASELREVRRVLKDFPGSAMFWWRAYRLLEADGDLTPAWDALSNARRLEPENSRYHAISLVLAAKALPRHEADEQLQRVRASLDSLGPDVCLMYAHAELELARKSRKQARWQRARDAVERGLASAPSMWLSKNLRATRLILDSLLAGREPSFDILYDVGLGEEVATASPGGNVIELVTRLSKRQINTDAPLAA